MSTPLVRAPVRRALLSKDTPTGGRMFHENVIRENYEPIGGGVVRDFQIWSASLTDAGPVNRLKAGIDESFNPPRRQIHVDQQLHARGRESSRCLRVG